MDQACEILTFGIPNGPEQGRYAFSNRLDVCPAVEKELHRLALHVFDGRVQGGPAASTESVHRHAPVQQLANRFDLASFAGLVQLLHSLLHNSAFPLRSRTTEPVQHAHAKPKARGRGLSWGEPFRSKQRQICRINSLQDSKTP